MGQLIAAQERWFVGVLARGVETRLEPRSEEALDLLRRAGYLQDEEEPDPERE